MKLITNQNKDTKYDVIELIVAQAILDRSDKIELIIELEIEKINKSIISKLNN